MLIEDRLGLRPSRALVWVAEGDSSTGNPNDHTHKNICVFVYANDASMVCLAAASASLRLNGVIESEVKPTACVFVDGIR